MEGRKECTGRLSFCSHNTKKLKRFSSERGCYMKESYMTIKEFCERLQISQSTVYRMIKCGMIPAIKFGRYWKIPRSVFDNIR